jgi:peptidoglycan/xylan/chitin deacetylase (PgdA/CDA1 family)
MMLLTVNYHYINVPEYPFPGIHGLTAEYFLEHIKWIKKYFELISVNQINDAVLSGMKLPERTCLITFDDGLKSNYDVVFQLMKKFHFPATFFVSAEPIYSNKVLNTHKMPYIRANVEQSKLNKMLDDYILKNNINKKLLNVKEEIIKEHYQYDSFATAKFKYLLSYILPDNIKLEFIDDIFNTIVDSERDFVKYWYMSADQIKEIHESFGSIGSHAWSHKPLSKLSFDEARMEIFKSKEYLECILNDKVYAISYPLGNKEAVSRREAELACQAGYSVGWTMERAFNATLNDPLLLARFDCNDLPEVGKQPVFSIVDGQVLHENKSLSLFRNRYCTEKINYDTE